jgi:SAM-dependent methyltransferase
MDKGQRQTQESFAYKWRQRSTYEGGMPDVSRAWLIERYGFDDITAMRDYFGSRRRILDAGCGSGFSSSLWLTPAWRRRADAAWVGADISAAIAVAQERLGDIDGTHFVQADVMQPPFEARSFDTIFSEGVLHHTPSTERAFMALTPLLADGGEILFYVYRRKAPVREFTDDFIRERVSQMEPQAAWDALKPLTELGRALAELNAQIDLPDDIPLLGIKAGRHDVQRLVYWHFLKAFWNPALSFDENHHVNFDWHHPRYAHRHTEEEVRGWCERAGLTIARFNAQESGFTVRAVKH